MFALAFLLITLAYSADINFVEKVGDSNDETHYFKINEDYFKTDGSECFYYDNGGSIKFFKGTGDDSYSCQIFTNNKCSTTDPTDSSKTVEPTKKDLVKLGANDNIPTEFFIIEYSNGETDATKKTFNKIISQKCSLKMKYEMTNLGAFRIQYEDENCLANTKVKVIDYYLGNSPSYATYTISVITTAADFVKENPSTVTNSPPVKKTLDVQQITLDEEYYLIFSETEGYIVKSSDSSVINEENKLYPVTDQSANVIATIKEGDKITQYIFSTKDSSKNQYMIFGKYLIKVTYNANSEIEGTIQLSYKNGLNDDKEGDPTAVFTDISSKTAYYKQQEQQEQNIYTKYKTGVCEKESENKYFMFEKVHPANEGYPIAKVEAKKAGCEPAVEDTITLLQATDSNPSSDKTFGEIVAGCDTQKSEEYAAEIRYTVINKCMAAGSGKFKKYTVENNEVKTYEYTSNDCVQSPDVPGTKYGTCNTCESNKYLICDTSSDPKTDVSSSEPKINDVSSSEPKINDDSSNEPKVNDVSSSTPKVNDVSSSTPKVNDDSSNQPKINDDSSSQTKMNNDSSTNNKPPSPPPSSGASPSSMFITMLLVIFVFLF